MSKESRVPKEKQVAMQEKQCEAEALKPVEHLTSTADKTSNGSGQLKQYLAASIITILSFAQGAVTGWPSTTLPLLESDNNPIGPEPITKEDASWIGSLLGIGAIMSVPFFCYFGNYHSRKIAGYLAALPLIPSWLLIIYANSPKMLYVARFLAGLSCGGGTVLIPHYIAEISEDHIRGRLSSLMVLLFNSGILFAYLVGSCVNYHVLGNICLTIAILFTVAFYFVPESPIYLVKSKRTTEAEKSLNWLRGGQNKVVEQEMSKLKHRIQSISQKNLPLRDVLLNKGTIKGLLIGIGLGLNNQLCGILAVLSYTVNIFQEAGGSISPHTATVLVGVLQVVGTYIASYLVDRTGRRTLLIVSNISVTICLAVLGTYFYLKESHDVSSYSWVPTVTLCVYVVVVAIGVGSLIFLITSEIFSEQARTYATTVCMCNLWILMFLVLKFFSSLISALGLYGCYWFFSCCCVLGALFSYFCVPETKNKSLETILMELNGEKPLQDRKLNGYAV